VDGYQSPIASTQGLDFCQESLARRILDDSILRDYQPVPADNPLRWAKALDQALELKRLLRRLGCTLNDDLESEQAAILHADRDNSGCGPNRCLSTLFIDLRVRIDLDYLTGNPPGMSVDGFNGTAEADFDWARRSRCRGHQRRCR
jgi:hypothetical protein